MSQNQTSILLIQSIIESHIFRFVTMHQQAPCDSHYFRTSECAIVCNLRRILNHRHFSLNFFTFSSLNFSTLFLLVRIKKTSKMDVSGKKIQDCSFSFFVLNCSLDSFFTLRSVFIFLVVFIGSYTAIINVLNNALWNPERYEQWGISEDVLSTAIPTLSGLTQTLLFTVCPQIFKIVAYKSGEATSFESGDQQAMIYFWYFYLVVRYLGQLVVQSFNKLTKRKGQ